MKILTRKKQRDAILKIVAMGMAWIKTNSYIPPEEKEGLSRMQAEYLVDLADVIGGLDGVKVLNCALSSLLDKRKSQEDSHEAPRP